MQHSFDTLVLPEPGKPQTKISIYGIKNLN